MKRVATIILNRNLPDVTNKLCSHLLEFDGDVTDVYVVESGSDPEKLSKYATWYVNDPEVMKNGLRYGRGMNYGLHKLLNEEKYDKYDAFFLLTNDTEFKPLQSIKPLLQIMDEHPRVGILSPCSDRWGEKLLLNKEDTKYFWFILNNAYLLRKEFIDTICIKNQPDYMNFLFDGSNFRGYGIEHELIAKAYVNDWAAAITNRVWSTENERHLLERADQIKTDDYESNFKLFIEEGRQWMRNKYGFNSHWSMQQYVKLFYDKFFEFHPEYMKYKI